MKEKQKCIIFGAGERGTRIYQKLSLVFEVIAYADNNSKKWGEQVNGINIISPDELPELAGKTNSRIFIANELHYMDIARQLQGMGLSFYNCDNYTCYELEDGIWNPVSLGNTVNYKKEEPDKLAVLFVQNKPCTRTNKIAEALKSRGVLTYSAYITAPSDAGNRAYIEEFPFWSFRELLEFVNESEFDIIHCSNEPDVMVNLLIHSNKKVIHDCHDVVTMSSKMVSHEDIALELIANTQADGMIYTTERMREIILRKYGGDPDKTFVLGNYPLSSFSRVPQLPKLSGKGGEIHCVYEGHIVGRTEAEAVEYRFFEPVFKRLAQQGVHIHIYSQCVPEYLKKLDRENPNIHYEGSFTGHELITEMTRYDLGLLMFPKADTTYLEMCSPNKLTEYLAARLPVVTNIKTYADIMAKHHCGGALDLEHDDIITKLKEYRQIPISSDFCDVHGFTMDSNADRILRFYKEVLGR